MKKRPLFLILLLSIILVFLGITILQPTLISYNELPPSSPSMGSSSIQANETLSTLSFTTSPPSTIDFFDYNDATITPSTNQFYPLTIDYLQQQSYPSSAIIIEETLESGSNYERYIVSYQSEGLKIFALLTIPAGETPVNGWPVILFNHGYIPPTQYRATERYEAYVDAFAHAGYLVFRSDYRGHGESEGVPINAYGSPGYTVDILNAVSSLKDYYLADPDRIGMWGHSMGGWITLRAMIVDPDIKAGVIWAGMVPSYPDLLMKWGWDYSTPDPTLTEITSRQRWLYSFIDVLGDPIENPENWAPLSANSYLNQLSGSIQLHHGTADTEVPIEFSITLMEQIQNAGGSVEFFTYLDDNHNISNNFSIAMYRSIDFFSRYLKENQ